MKTLTKISAILLAMGMLVIAGQTMAGPTDSQSVFERIYGE